MNANLLIKHGNTNNYIYKKIDIPKPTKNSVVIRVCACAINNTDIWTKKGLYSKDTEDGWNPNFKLPIIQGADISGFIYDILDNKKLIGKRVIVYPVINTNEFKDEIDIITHCKYLGSEVNGGYAQYCVIPLSNIVIVPNYCKLNYYELSSFPTAYMTALHMINRCKLINTTKIKTLVTGASGGVGFALMNLLKLKNIDVIGLSSNKKKNKLQHLTKCKIVSREEENLEQKLISENNDKDFDIIFDVVAGDLTEKLLNIIKPNGSYVCSGAISNRNVNIYWPNFYLKHLNLLGSMLATKKEFLELCFLIFNGEIKPEIYKIYPLKNLVEAQTEFENKNHIGKIILDCE